MLREPKQKRVSVVFVTIIIILLHSNSIVCQLGKTLQINYIPIMISYMYMYHTNSDKNNCIKR